MYREEKPAYIMAQVACVMAEIAGMRAQNQSDVLNKKEPTYKRAEFLALIDQYGISHNAVLTLLGSEPAP